MSTTCSVVLFNKETGKYHANSVNWDGYPEGVGFELVRRWQDTEKVIDALTGPMIRGLVGGEAEKYEDEDDAGRIHDTYEAALDFWGDSYNYLYTEGEWHIYTKARKLERLEDFLDMDKMILAEVQ